MFITPVAEFLNPPQHKIIVKIHYIYFFYRCEPSDTKSNRGMS